MIRKLQLFRCLTRSPHIFWIWPSSNQFFNLSGFNCEKFAIFIFQPKLYVFMPKKCHFRTTTRDSTLDGDQELQLEVFNCFDFRFQRCNCLNNFEFSSTVDQELKCFQTLQESLPDLGVLARVRNTGSSNFYRIKTSANI